MQVREKHSHRAESFYLKEAAEIECQEYLSEGMMEGIQGDLRKQRQFVSRFFAILFEKGLINEDDALMILGSSWEKV